jgi:hypothetical protein
MRNYEGTTRLQGIGICEGIKAINLKVGDERVFNFGSTEEIIRIEQTKTGKSVKVTCKYFDRMSKVIDGQWIGEWKEDTRTIGVNTIIVVKELNPVEETSIVEELKAESEAVINSINTESLENQKESLKAVSIELNKIDEAIKNNLDNEEIRLQLRDIENNLKYHYSGLDELIETQKEDNIEFIVSEDIHTKTGEKIFVAKLTKTVSKDEFINISIQVKSIGGYWSKFKKGFLFKVEPTKLLKDTFNNLESNNGTTTNKLIELEPVEIDINNINVENFPIDKEISKRENDGHWTFRVNERDHQQEILNYLQSFQDTFINELEKLEDKTNINTYKRWLNGFKKRYYDNYYKKLRNDASNPSWITTGRGGRSTSKDKKYADKYNNLMHEYVALDEEFKKKLGEIKVKVRKENDKKFANDVLSNKKEYEYKRVKKLINMSSVNNYFEGSNLVEKNCYMTTVNNQEFYIINVWSRFVAVNSKGQEVGKASCQTLKDCKVILNYYLAEFEKIDNIAV